MRGDFTFGPLDIQGPEHGKIGADVRCVGIEQRTVPVEQDGTRGILDEFQDKRIVSEGSLADKRLGTGGHAHDNRFRRKPSQLLNADVAEKSAQSTQRALALSTIHAGFGPML